MVIADVILISHVPFRIITLVENRKGQVTRTKKNNDSPWLITVIARPSETEINLRPRKEKQSK